MHEENFLRVVAKTGLKDELSSAAIQITCYDRNGEVVKRVTSTDPGTVEDSEDNENSQNTENGGSERGSGSGSEQSGGGGFESGD